MKTATKPHRRPYRFTANTRSSKELDYMVELDQHIQSSGFSMLERFMNFPLYVPRQNLTTFLCKYEIFKRVLAIQGSIVECGVLFGGGTLTFAQLSAIFEPTNHQRRVIGFDTFAGHRPMHKEDINSASAEAKEGGFAVDSYAEITRSAVLHDLNRFVGHIPKVELVRGDASKTIPKYVKDNPHLIVSLLYLDFDVYGPTEVAIKTIVPRMPKGAIIAFDELNLKDWPGETQALLKRMRLRELRLERFPFGSTISFAEIS